MHLTGHVKDQDIILHAMPAIEHRQEISLDYAIANTDRSVGAMLSGEIAKRYGDAGLRNIHLISNSKVRPDRASAPSLHTVSTSASKGKPTII